MSIELLTILMFSGFFLLLAKLFFQPQSSGSGARHSGMCCSKGPDSFYSLQYLPQPLPTTESAVCVVDLDHSLSIPNIAVFDQHGQGFLHTGPVFTLVHPFLLVS